MGGKAANRTVEASIHCLCQPLLSMLRRALLTAAALLPFAALAQASESISSFVANRGAASVAKDLKAIATVHAGWRYFNLRWQWPDQILGAFQRAGIATVADALAWADRMAATLSHTDVEQMEREFGKLPDGVDPALMPSATVDAIHVQYIAAQANATNGICGLTPDHEAWPNGDPSYKLASEDNWKALLQAYPGALKPYVATANDCEKSVDNFKGWLCDMRLGVLACAKVWLEIYSGTQQAPSGHVTTIIVTDMGKALFLEPQDRALQPLTYTQFNGYRGDLSSMFFRATATRIARLLI
jgi:hypothetical protein